MSERVFAVANQKGGVGKTTTAVSVSAALAEMGQRVLLADLDPQGNATTGVGIDPRSLERTMYDVLVRGEAIENTIEGTAVRNLFVAPSSLDLAGAEIELVSMFSRERKLRQALAPVRGDYDFIFIDCPPSLGLLTVNALAAAGEVLIPVQCEYYALEGVAQLIRNVMLVREDLNPELDISTIVLVMYDARTRLAEQVVEEVRAHFGAKVCRAVVPRSVRLSEAPSHGQPITVFDPGSRGAHAYRQVAREILAAPAATAEAAGEGARAPRARASAQPEDGARPADSPHEAVPEGAATAEDGRDGDASERQGEDPDRDGGDPTIEPGTGLVSGWGG
jgi:chromosome partitioning protein